jgi:phosphohistidine phosphatase
MFLYLVQHAEAKKKEEDPERGLSKKGMQDLSTVAQFASRLGIKTLQIYHSGKTRTLQTAQTLADKTETGKGISETDGLNPLDDPQIWFERISRMKEHIMLVGHLPHLSKLASLILCGDRGKNIIDFKMGGIVCLKRLEDDKWSINWILTPEVVL